VLGSNVYRFEVADQTGASASARASAKVSIVLRSADAALLTGIVGRWDGTHWVPLKTAPPGVNGAYLAVVTQFGEYAVVRPGPAASPGSSAAGASASAGPSASGAAGPSTASSPAATPIPAGTASGGQSPVLPILAAVGIALVVLVVMLLLARRSGPPAPPAAPRRGSPKSTSPYRGAHRLDGDD